MHFFRFGGACSRRFDIADDLHGLDTRKHQKWSESAAGQVFHGRVTAVGNGIPFFGQNMSWLDSRAGRERATV